MLPSWTSRYSHVSLADAATGKDYPKSKQRTTIYLSDIPTDRFLDENVRLLVCLLAHPADACAQVWLLFWKISTTRRSENEYRVLYEVGFQRLCEVLFGRQPIDHHLGVALLSHRCFCRTWWAAPLPTPLSRHRTTCTARSV